MFPTDEGVITFRADYHIGAEIFKISVFYKACPFSSFGAGKTVPVTIRAARLRLEIASFTAHFTPVRGGIFHAADFHDNRTYVRLSREFCRFLGGRWVERKRALEKGELSQTVSPLLRRLSEREPI
jgi:hypothetical protein